MTKKGISKAEVCELSDEEILSKMIIKPIENSRNSLVEFNGKTYISRSNNFNDIIKKVRKKCACGCGGDIII